MHQVDFVQDLLIGGAFWIETVVQIHFILKSFNFFITPWLFGFLANTYKVILYLVHILHGFVEDILHV